ncbi:alpha-L-fucosidase [candidate division KSB1 bacterium]|nr:alpha-L-fucosidase [candidate division KSB1 bacterium]
MRRNWLKNYFRQVHLDFHIPEFPPEALTNFDPIHLVDALERSQVNLVTLFAKCHFGNAYYFTEVGHRHRNLTQDILLETSQECRRRGIATLAYYSLGVDKRAFDENPAWRYLDAEGHTYSGTFGSVCMNTPYKDELALPQILEIIQRYPVDGLFIDIPVPWGAPDYFCFCPSCQRRWRVEFNQELTPALAPLVRQKLNLRTIESWLLQIRDLIQRTNPALVLCLNIAGGAAFSKTIKEWCDIGVWESQPRPGDYLGHSFACRTGRNDVLEVQVMTVRFYEGWGDLSLKPAAQLLTECSVIIGNGLQPNVGDQANVDGALQNAVYDTLGQAFEYVAQRESVLRDAESVRHTVVLLPTPDPDLPLITGPVLNGTCPHWKEMADPWRGAHKMLVESHLQTDLIYSVMATRLQQYPVLVLPEPGSYQPGFWERLREYVAAGGILVAVGNSILENGTCPLADVFGIRYLEPLTFSVAHFLPQLMVQGATAAIPLQVRGQVFKVLCQGAFELAELWLPVGETQPPVKGFRHPCPPAAAQRSPFPFATLHTFGKGQAVYIAASIFDIYWRTNHHWLRQFMEAVLRYIDPHQPYEIDASGRIEANLMRTGHDLLLNLMHYALGHQGGQHAIAGIERVEPVHNIPVRVRCQQVQEVRIEPEGTSLKFNFTSGICDFVVPEITYLTIIRLVGAV